MEKLIHFLEDEAKKADRRYQSLCKDIETGLEGVGGVDAMVKRAKAAQHEKTYYKFFYELRARYESDKAHDDMPGFIAHCLDLIQDEFKNYVDKDEALSEARQALLKKLTPILAGL